MLCCLEVNRKSDVAMAIRHRLSGIPIYGINGLENEDEHPAYAPVEYGPFNFT